MNEVKSLGEIVKQLRSCGYTCEAGPLENNAYFQTLERIAGIPPEKSLKEMVDEVSEIMMKGPFILPKSPQQIRDEIVAKAKADVASIVGEYEGFRTTIGRFDKQYVIPKFFVNKEKRAVTVLIYGGFSHDLLLKGIAKADPSDCFNSSIGRAIALRRALGLEVPAEYYNAPAPTEVRVGDVVERSNISRTVVSDKQRVVGGKTCHIGSVRAKYGRIIDDSRE